MRWLSFVLSVFVCSSIGGAVPAAAQSGVARFNRAACPFKLAKGMVEGHDAYCGYLVVPENRATATGRIIRLAVAVFKSRSASAAPAPLILLQGGPGSAIVQALGSIITPGDAGTYVGNQDLILVDQRGNGLSIPFLGCNPARDTVTSSVDRQAGQAVAQEGYLRAALRCYRALEAVGIDLNAYTTIADAADIAELGPALGYRQVNVYAVSYGTRVALTLMRLYPANIRSVILDAVLPTPANIFTQMPASMSRVFAVLFDGCRQDAACNRTYPHLDRTFYTLVSRLNARPVTIKATPPGATKAVDAVLTGDRLANMVYQMFDLTSNIPAIPQLIEAAGKGSYRYVAERLFGAVSSMAVDGAGISEGTYYSVECGEDAPYTSAQRIRAAIDEMPAALQGNARTSQIATYEICERVWHVATVPAAQKRAVHSAIPTLVLNGQYDPLTPPDLGELAATTLSKANSYTFPGVGHGAYLSAACPHSIAVAFLANPDKRPDAGCIKTMTGPQWVTTKVSK